MRKGSRKLGLHTHTLLISLLFSEIITEGPDTTVTSELHCVFKPGDIQKSHTIKSMCGVCVCVWSEREQEKDQMSGIKHISVWSDMRDNPSHCHLSPCRQLDTHTHTHSESLIWGYKKKSCSLRVLFALV